MYLALALSKTFITWRPVSTINIPRPVALLLQRLIKQTVLTLKQKKTGSEKRTSRSVFSSDFFTLIAMLLKCTDKCLEPAL